MKITYTLCVFFCVMYFITLALITPVWVTPGYYWWTAFFLIQAFAISNKAGKRFDSML